MDNEHTDISLEDVTLHTELFVKMTCQSCVNAVTSLLETLSGVQNVKIDLPKELVTVTGTESALSLLSSLSAAGREARLIGIGATTGDEANFEAIQLPESVGSYAENSNCVAEFKGEKYGHNSVIGVVRLIQLGNDDSLCELSLEGLQPGGKYETAIHVSGDLSKGHDSIGKAFLGQAIDGQKPAGILCTLNANDEGKINFYGFSKRLRVWEIIGRSLAVDLICDGEAKRQAAAVIARSAGPGGNYKKVCSCDGTVIYEANGNL